MYNYKDLNWENYKLILNSCLFDEKWYVGYYFNNSVDINFDPITHFLIKGVFENYNPNPLFNTAEYLSINKDVANLGVNPLIHYIQWGKLEKRLFSTNFAITYSSLEEELYYKDIDAELKSTIESIIEQGIFDNDFYLNEYPDVKKVNVNPLIHYLKIGAKQHKNPSKTFNTQNYFKNHPEIEKNNINPLIHYVNNNSNNNSSITSKEEDFDFNLYCNADQIQYLYKKIISLENELKFKTNEYEEILNTYNNYFDYLYVNKHILNPGIIRNTQLQTVEMLKFLANICDKYGLSYWLDYGTLIGAIRHSGFIPWDDDIDIGMPRDDYEKLLKILPSEIEKHELLNGRINFQILSHRIREFAPDYAELFPTPCIQFVDKVPLANVDFFILDYYEITPDNAFPLFKNQTFARQLLINFNNNIQNKNSSEINEECLRLSEELGIKFEKTEYLGCTLDSAGIRFPTHINNIFPLKKATFEGFEFNVPNDPLKYLSFSHYNSNQNNRNIMSLPKKMQHHDRLMDINKQFPEGNIEKEIKKAVNLWKYVNGD